MKINSINKATRLVTALFIFLFSFTPSLIAHHPIINEDVRLQKFSDFFIKTIWSLHPDQAVYAGYRDADTIVEMISTETVLHNIQVLSLLRDTLKKFDEQKLSKNFKTDLWIMQDKVAAELFYLEEYKEKEWNPAIYNIGGPCLEILNNREMSLPVKLRKIDKRLQRCEAYYQSAAVELVHPVIEHTDLAILQNQGTIQFLQQTLTDSIQQSDLDQETKALLISNVNTSTVAVTDYISWLKELRSGMNAQNSRSFVLGKELYYKKFQYDLQSAFTAEEMYRKAQERKKEVIAEMTGISKTLWPKYFPGKKFPVIESEGIKELLTAISLNHADPDSFMQSIEAQIPELIAFVNQKQLLFIDPAKPLVVRPTPPFMEGSGAPVTISAPGPYDKNGNTYYNVSPMSGYSKEKAESYLREYNKYTMQILNIHEAIPGHYTQLVYSNLSPSMIKSIFGNGAMIEGWAVYTERMMLEEGYGNNMPEMWLMYYKWHLRSVCNTILDYEVHVNGLSEPDAIRFLTHEAFQESAEAEGKWRRVKLTQVQLCSYFTGYSEIYALRKQYKQKTGDQFSLKHFHEKFLGYGSAPVKYISRMMLTGL